MTRKGRCVSLRTLVVCLSLAAIARAERLAVRDNGAIRIAVDGRRSSFSAP